MCFLSEQVLPTDESVEHKKSHRQSHRKKVLPEIYLTRLLSTKVGRGQLALGVCGEQPAQAGAAGGRSPGRWGPGTGGGSRFRSRFSNAAGLLQLPSARAEQREAPRHLPRLSWALCVWC